MYLRKWNRLIDDWEKKYTISVKYLSRTENMCQSREFEIQFMFSSRRTCQTSRFRLTKVLLLQIILHRNSTQMISHIEQKRTREKSNIKRKKDNSHCYAWFFFPLFTWKQAFQLGKRTGDNPAPPIRNRNNRNREKKIRFLGLWTMVSYIYFSHQFHQIWF